jgi:serine/threonine protein kinase
VSLACRGTRRRGSFIETSSLPNVYVSRYGREMDFVKVLDFGLVKSERETEPGNVTLTRAQGTIGGTPAFKSPEQVLGVPGRRPPLFIHSSIPRSQLYRRV